MALEFAAERSQRLRSEITYARTAERVGTVAADVFTAHTHAAKRLLEQWAREWAADKLEETKHRAVTAAEKSLLRALAGEEGAEAGIEFLNAAQTALAIAAVAAQIAEAKKFEKAFPTALQHPKGKRFFLTLDYTFKAVPTAVPQPVTIVRQPGAPTKSSITVGVGAGIVRGFGQAPSRTQVVAGASAPGGLKVEADQQAFLYWYATRRRS